MASITKHGNHWRAQVYKQGQRRSAVWPTKTEAKEWAARMEAQLDKRLNGGNSSIALADAIERDLETKDDRWTRNRMAAFARAIDVDRLKDVTTGDITRWRNARLKEVAASTVAREANMVRSFFRRCVEEWEWIANDPCAGVKMPTGGQPRHQRWRWQEIRKVARNLGYVTGKRPETKSQETAYAFLIALRTAMRAAEVRKAELHGNVAYLTKTKTTKLGDLVKVPLTAQGVRLMKRAGPLTVSAGSLDALFRRAMHRTMVSNLTFHDTRATALTLLAKKVDILTLSRISRHKDLSLLSNVYYRETAEEIAARL